jgi:hypothetical protein
MDQRPPGHPQAEAGGRHREQGHRPIKPPGFWSEFKSNPRELPFVFVSGLGAISWGIETALSGDAHALNRLAGAVTAAGGALIWLSYLLYFKPGSLATPGWQQVPSRRRVAFVIRHLWLGVLIILGAAWLANWIARP